MKSKFVKRLTLVLILLFALINVIAYLHAYKFTHFDDAGIIKTKDAHQLSFGEKAGALFFGISNPRPENNSNPTRNFETVKLKSNKEIECWYMPSDSAKGTVILCHGYGGHKSSLLDKAEQFLKQGYSTLLIDFMGSGGSEGNQTTIGFYEAEEVKTAFDYLTKKGETNIILFGTSMGAVAIMKAISDHQLPAKAIIIECPFGTMLETVQARFKTMHVPAFPMANLLVFWGGWQNGFDAFSHNPAEYARQINCPALLLYGEKDEKVSRAEINTIFANLKGPKELKLYPQAGHENYLKKYKQEWIRDVSTFLLSIENKNQNLSCR